jgi:hypothetical protein
MPPTSSTAPSNQKLRSDRVADPATRQAELGGAQADERLFTHLLTVLSVSSGMVGVCLTAIGLIGIIKSLNKVEMLVDDLLAIGTMMFMVTSLFSFFAMRTRLSQTWRSITRTIDIIFCLALVLVAVASAVLTWEVL